MTDDPNVEPRDAVRRALVSRDAAALEAARSAYYEWYERTETDLVLRDELPRAFESAVYVIAQGVGNEDRDELARVVGWVAAAAANDPRVEPAAKVFARTGLFEQLELWSGPDDAGLVERAVRSLDAERIAAAFLDYELWARREFAPFPERLLADLHMVLGELLSVEPGLYERVAAIARPGGDDRLEWLTHAVREFERPSPAPL